MSVKSQDSTDEPRESKTRESADETADGIELQPTKYDNHAAEAQNGASARQDEPNAQDHEEGAEKNIRRAKTVRKPLVGKAPLSFIDKAILDASEVQNRRLLPDTKNPLHIIDGPENRYFLGIIDFLTLYECRQRTGRLLKNIKFCCADHSTVHPTRYGQRFLDFFKENTAQ